MHNENLTEFNDKEVGYVLYLSSSLLDICFNTVALYILIHMKYKKFFQIVTIMTFNSLIVNLNDSVVFIYGLMIRDQIYIAHSTIFYPDHSYVNFMTYIFYPIWNISYSFGSLLDTYLVYERIQLLRAELKFIKNTPVWIVALFLLFIACSLNITVYLSREVNVRILNTNTSNKTLYFIDTTYISQNIGFIFYTYFNNFVRDGITVLIDILFNISLVQSMKRFNARHLFLSTQSHSVSILKKSERKNIFIAFILCLMSVFIHIVSFLTFMLFISGLKSVWTFTSLINGILHSIKNAMNFFIYLLLNEKFKK